MGASHGEQVFFMDSKNTYSFPDCCQVKLIRIRKHQRLWKCTYFYERVYSPSESHLGLKNCDCECLYENDVVDCKYPIIGNGICNDENNNAYCYYDGGDCSANSFSTTLSSTSTEAPYECCGKLF